MACLIQWHDIIVYVDSLIWKVPDWKKGELKEMSVEQLRHDPSVAKAQLESSTLVSNPSVTLIS